MMVHVNLAVLTGTTILVPYLKDQLQQLHWNTVKPVCNGHLYNNIYYLWFIQQCVLMKTEGINLLLLTISAFWSSYRWPLAT